MEEKFLKLLIKRYKSKENIRRFLIERISDIGSFIFILLVFYIILLLQN